MIWKNIVDYLRDLNFVTMLLRFVLAAFGGGVIGYSRGKRQHAAGLRTHLLVCIGSASIMITSQFFIEKLGMPGDIVRMPAQVVSGVGFLGAGSILVTGKKHITGLTTAAGLWASACMGLAAGAGFYECAIVMCLLIYLVLVVLDRMDATYVKVSRTMTVYMELKDDARLSSVLSALKENGIQVSSMEPFGGTAEPGYLMELELMREELTREEALSGLEWIPGVAFCAEMKN